MTHIITDRFRRAVHSLESHTDLRNLISEEEDSCKAYEKVIKATDTSVKFLNKWTLGEGTEHKELTQVVVDFHAQHSIILTEFTYKYKKYVQMLKDILAAMEKYEAAEKHVKEVEAKVEKKKLPQSSLNDAKSVADAALAEMNSIKQTNFRESMKLVSKSYCEMYQSGLQLMTQQLSSLDNVPTTAQEKSDSSSFTSSKELPIVPTETAIHGAPPLPEKPAMQVPSDPNSTNDAFVNQTSNTDPFQTQS